MLPSLGTPDPTALAVAKAAQDAVQHSAIILFGSRATGTHRPDSDVDLLLVFQESGIAEQARAQMAVKSHVTKNHLGLRVDIVPMELGEFHYCRRAKNHVAGQASRKGIVMSGERLGDSGDYEDGYPESWPDVKWRIRAAYRNLGGFRREFEHLEGEQENYCFHAQQAIENSLKAWISAAELDYSGVHDLDSIARSVLDDPRESSTLAAQQLRILLEYATAEDPEEPGQSVNWLTQYATWYRYHGTNYRMSEAEKGRFVDAIILSTRTFINRAQELTGTTDDNLAQ